MITFSDEFEQGSSRKQPLSDGLVAVILAYNDEATIQNVIKKTIRRCCR